MEANTARHRAWAAAAARHGALPGVRVRPITSRRSSRAEGAGRREAEPITHYTVLATIEAAYMLPRDVLAFTEARITNI